MPDFTIRRASRDDLEAMTAIDPKLRTEPQRAEHIAPLLDLGLSWLAERDGRALAYVIATTRFFDRPFVDLLVVADEARRLGVGTALMAACEDQHDDDRLFTSTNESNQPMRALLAKAGYRVSGVIENLDPGDPELVFVKFRPVEI